MAQDDPSSTNAAKAVIDAIAAIGSQVASSSTRPNERMKPTDHHSSVIAAKTCTACMNGAQLLAPTASRKVAAS